MVPAGALNRAFQISVGFGAGNIGDEFMGRAFWDALPLNISLDVALFPEHARQRAPYPSRHRYVPVEWSGNENRYVENAPGLLVGDTPVTEAEGLRWPLKFLAPRLLHFHQRGLPVYALGTGVDLLASKCAREIFRRAFHPIRSWTVRSEPCRKALLEMGVFPDRVIVGADWAWLYRKSCDRRDWAAGQLRVLGIDPAAPLLIANVVNILWQGATEARRNIASALDRLSVENGFQICFFSNECRDGEFFDHAAASQIRGLMRRPAVLFPNLYYSPDEALGILSHATVTVAQRYHFAIQSLLAGSIPVCLVRGQKMHGLVEELDLPAPGSIDCVESANLETAVLTTWQRRVQLLRRLDESTAALRERASHNLDLIRQDCPEINGPVYR